MEEVNLDVKRLQEKLFNKKRKWMEKNNRGSKKRNF